MYKFMSVLMIVEEKCSNWCSFHQCVTYRLTRTSLYKEILPMQIRDVDERIIDDGRPEIDFIAEDMYHT